MAAKRVGNQDYVQLPRDSIITPAAYVRADWDDLTEAEKEQIRDQLEREEEDEDDD